MLDVVWIIVECLDVLFDVDVVMVVCGGQDLSCYGLCYSYLVFLLCEDDGCWCVMYLFNCCKIDCLQLYYEGLGNFVGESGGYIDLCIGVFLVLLCVVLKVMLVLLLIQFKVLYEVKYNVVVYLFVIDYQNFNQWVLEVLVVVMVQVEGMLVIVKCEQVQQWLCQYKYQFSVLYIGFGKCVGVCLFVVNVIIIDYLVGECIFGNYLVVMVELVFDFLYQCSQLQQELVIFYVLVVGVIVVVF